MKAPAWCPDDIWENANTPIISHFGRVDAIFYRTLREHIARELLDERLRCEANESMNLRDAYDRWMM